ncbi:MAG: TonB family protein [Chloracidobacterium sp.]|nr:TonB family protein [Chloracidobacterium sp.]MCC6825599.1 TonB family protein [Acidobacteriota bacterium]
MPLNVRRFCSSVLLVLIVSIGFTAAQTTEPAAAQSTQPATSGDMMRQRISKAKAFIVVRNYNAAIYELENIRRESADPAVQSVVNVLLMNSYLEQGDYKRAQELLNDLYNQQKTTKAGAAANYRAAAGQIVKGAKDRAERYRTLGLSITDKTLPLEALNDLDRMRETLELVITQGKEIAKTPARSQDAMAMLEEAAASRSILGRDDYDSRRWKDELSDTREALANSRSVILDAMPGTTAVAAGTPGQTLPANPAVQPAAAPVAVVASAPSQPAATVRERQVQQTAPPKVENTVAVKNVPEPKKEEPRSAAPPIDPTTPLEVGGRLVSYATEKAQPIYPAIARTVRATGTVTVQVTVDEHGKVTSVEKTTGPELLQGAAEDAIRKWRFKPFTRDGQPVRANGYVNFNFSL